MSEATELARGPRTRAVTDPTGWSWLGPRPWVVRLAGAAVLVPGALVAALLTAVVPELPTALALGLIALLLVAAAIGGVAAWRFAHTRAGVSPIGLAVQRGAAPAQIAWRSVARIRVAEDGGPAAVRLAIEHDDRTVAVPLRLDPHVAASWLERAASLAPQGVHVDRIRAPVADE